MTIPFLIWFEGDKHMVYIVDQFDWACTKLMAHSHCTGPGMGTGQGMGLGMGKCV